MIVLMVLDALYVGGTETHVLAVTRQLLKMGHRVVICGKEGPLSLKFRSLACPVYHIDFENTRDETKRKRAESELIRIVTTEHVDLIHAHQFPSGSIGCEVGNACGVPVVFTVHSMLYDDEETQHIAQRSAKTVSVSMPVYERLHGLGIPSSVIPNGIDLKTFRNTGDQQRIRRRLGIPTHTTVVLYASRLSWEKASIAKRVIRACTTLHRQHHNIHLLIAGDGMKMSDVQVLANHSIQKARSNFINVIGSQDTMQQLYVASDIVVGTGRVALEAMACQRPVIAVGTAGFLGLLTPERMMSAWTDYYFGDHMAPQRYTYGVIKKELKKSLKSQKLRLYCGKKGRDFVKGQFNIHKITRTLIQVYESVLSN